MKPFCLSINAFVIAAALFVAGCGTMGQPKLREAMIEPAQLQPGDTALITVEIKDPHDVVNRVEAVVREDRRIALKLHDDGVPPDKKANDNVWTLPVDVPFQAPPGNFTLDFTAYRSDGRPVEIRNEAGDKVPLSGSFEMAIQYPEGRQSAAPAKEPAEPAE